MVRARVRISELHSELLYKNDVHKKNLTNLNCKRKFRSAESDEKFRIQTN